jgi:hypothetical protein
MKRNSIDNEREFDWGKTSQDTRGFCLVDGRLEDLIRVGVCADAVETSSAAATRMRAQVPPVFMAATVYAHSA